MIYILLIVSFVGGVIIGGSGFFIFGLFRMKTSKELARELYAENELKQNENLGEIIKKVEGSFGKLSLDALSASTTEFLKLANSKLSEERAGDLNQLDSKKELIDQQLQGMNGELEKVEKLIISLEKDRESKYSELANQLKNTNEQTSALTKTTNNLREALASHHARGQWGERMAEDVLRVAGFIENINYLKQKAIEGAGSKPDFTFLLPRALKLNMDVKFPWDNYIKYLETDSLEEKKKHLNDFFRDVKTKVKEVTSRDYINPEQNTVDYVILFIPNEQIFAFIHEQDRTIMDEALKSKVVFCSPITLFAVLAVIRQAVDNFILEQTSNEIISLLGSFKKQWLMFIAKMSLMGKSIEQVRIHYDSLLTTRARQLEGPLNKIEDIRTRRGLPIAQDDYPDQLSEAENNEIPI